jgi:hypothetical protein
MAIRKDLRKILQSFALEGYALSLRLLLTHCQLIQAQGKCPVKPDARLEPALPSAPRHSLSIICSQSLQRSSRSPSPALQRLKRSSRSLRACIANVAAALCGHGYPLATFATIRCPFEEQDSNVATSVSVTEEAIATFATRIVQGVVGAAGSAGTGSSLTPLTRWISARSSKTSGSSSGLPAYAKSPRTRLLLAL